MIQTWDWLLLHLPKDQEKQSLVLENMNSRKYEEIIVEDFILRFDFKNANIYCDCVENYELRHKVIPGKVSFSLVRDFLVTKNWDLIDETELELLYNQNKLESPINIMQLLEKRER